MILSRLTDDVEWIIPIAFHTKGKSEFAGRIVDQGFSKTPHTISITRLLDTSDVFVAEGAVRAPKEDGSFMNVVFCDLFDRRDGKIRRLICCPFKAKYKRTSEMTDIRL